MTILPAVISLALSIALLVACGGPGGPGGPGGISDWPATDLFAD